MHCIFETQVCFNNCFKTDLNYVFVLKHNMSKSDNINGMFLMTFLYEKCSSLKVY